MSHLREKPSIKPGVALPAPIRTPRAFLTFLLVWFAAHTILRYFLSPTANLDEAEQLMLTQEWALGYGPQPPLYTWIQAAIFQVVGIGILGLALLKNALLFCTYTLAYLNARLISRSHAIGVASALSLFFIPQISWESQRDLTHSVLASTLSLAALYCLLRVRRSDGIAWRLVLGAVLGCGALAKYNFLIWAVGLLAGGMLVKSYRVALLNLRTVAALLVAFAIVAPHSIWALNNRAHVTQTASKFAVGGQIPANNGLSEASESPASFVSGRASGALNMLWAIIRFLAPLCGVYAILMWWKRREISLRRPQTEELELLLRVFAVIGILLLLIVSVSGATAFKDRWFQPILIAVPILLAVWMGESSRDNLEGETLEQSGLANPFATLLWRVALIVMVLVATFIPSKVLFAKRTGRDERLNYPLPEIGEMLRSHTSPDAVIMADTPFIAGNLRLGSPQNRVVTKLWPGDVSAADLLVWDARERRRPPPDLLRAAGASPLTQPGVTLLTMPLRNQPERTYSLGAIDLRNQASRVEKE